LTAISSLIRSREEFTLDISMMRAVEEIANDSFFELIKEVGEISVLEDSNTG